MIRPMSFFLLLVASLITSNHTSAVNHCNVPYSRSSSDLETFGSAVLTIGGIAAAGYGFYKLCDWLFSKSDEEILKECKNACKNADNCMVYVDLVEHTVGIPYNAYEQRRVINTPQEELMYQLAALAFQRREGLNVYSNLKNAIDVLTAAQADLVYRMNKLVKKHGVTVDALPLFNQMEQMAAIIQPMQTKMAFVYDLLEAHHAYMNLFAQESYDLKTYERELFVLDSLQEKNCWVPLEHRKSSLREEVRIVAMQCASRDHAKYPYTYYLRGLQKAISRLESHMNALAYNYCNRISAASALLAKLKMISEIILTEDAYHAELRDAERDRIEQEKLLAQQRQAAALESQAWQMYEQNQQLQKQNQLKEKELRLEKERNAAIREQTAVLAAPQYNVYVAV